MPETVPVSVRVPSAGVRVRALPRRVRVAWVAGSQAPGERALRTGVDGGLLGAGGQREQAEKGGAHGAVVAGFAGRAGGEKEFSRACIFRLPRDPNY